MAEQEQERNKARAVRILKWELLSPLPILLILALVVQASWKIVTLLAIILAACTVLPKQFRKWFWLSVGAVVLALVIWVFMPEDNEGWRPYTFDAELAALDAKYAIPNEEDAALAYDAIFKTLDIDSNQPEFFLKTTPSSIDEPWLSKDHPETAEWLQGHRATIEEIIQAVKTDKGRNLPKMRQCTFLLFSAANNDIAEGRIDAGIEKYLCLIQMANHMCRQPRTYHVINFQYEEPILSLLNRFVVENRPTTEQLQRISNSIRGQEDNWGSDFIRILEYDKLAEKNRFCSLAYEVNQRGKVRLSRDYWIAAVGGAVFPKQISPTYFQRKVNKARTILNWFVYPSSPQKAAEILDRYFERYYAMAEPEYDWAKEPPELPFSLWTVSTLRRDQLSYKCYARYTAVMSETLYHHFHDSYLRILTLRRGSQVVIALKQSNINNGRWPEHLDAIKANVTPEALIDPQNNGSFVYGLTEDGFRLYSRGPNGKDEDGRHESDGPDDLPIWPPRQRAKSG